ncbi:ubiquitin carboxyl-terminal hydrolase family protein [Artemisia annua]|uniref:Ubiquitin carboxyl-terminal hydrolase family protein n=1 Tax=Artemisia annua TaxID=35608 RepID=A0A2U1LMB5_ARTAN|nr:ubiquitin carboxyl-terminal hydrolase family protein [Artemisia annua]
MSAVEEGRGEDVADGRLGFSVGFPRGFGLKRKSIEWLEEWQRLKYTSPYKDASHLDSRTDVSEKRAVGVFHELLHLMVEKKTERKNVSNLRKPLNLPQKFTKVFERHPGIFYISKKNNTQTVVLREAYDGHRLVEKHPISEIRDKFACLMKEGFLDRSRGLYKKRKDELHRISEDESCENGVESEEEMEDHMFSEYESDETANLYQFLTCNILSGQSNPAFLLAFYLFNVGIMHMPYRTPLKRKGDVAAFEAESNEQNSTPGNTLAVTTPLQTSVYGKGSKAQKVSRTGKFNRYVRIGKLRWSCPSFIVFLVCKAQFYVVLAQSVVIFDNYDPAYRLVALEPERGCCISDDCLRVISGCHGGKDQYEEYLACGWHSAYHVPTNMWTQLPDKSDMASRQWPLLGNDDGEKIIRSPNFCIQGTNQKLYTYIDTNDSVHVLADGKWKFVAILPANVITLPYITPFHGHLLFTSEADYSESHQCLEIGSQRPYLDKNLLWEHSGHVLSRCFTV